MRAPRSRLLVGTTVVAVTLVVAGAAAWQLVLRDSPEPASIDEAVRAFRERAEREGSRVPAGVYVYATTGFERIDALGGVRHAYPARTAVTAGAAPCGTLLRWAALQGRSTEWTTCDGEEAVTLVRIDERHRFFGRTERTTYTCADTLAFPPDGGPGDRWDVACDAGEVKERGAGELVAVETVAVGTVPVETLHVRVTTTFTGPTTGTAARDTWFERETGLPLRLVMRSRTTNGSPIGDVHYEEDVELELTSLEPRR